MQTDSYIDKTNSKRKRWIVFALASIIITISISSVLSTNGIEKRPVDKRLYIYSDSELSDFFNDIGYPDFWYSDIRISRNSDGTALRFLNTEKRKIIVVACDGSITTMESPGYLAWLNDDNRIVAWFKWEDNKSIVYYASGASERRSFSPYSGPDPSGKYFIKESQDSNGQALEESCHTTIYSTEEPNTPIVKVNICSTQRIFYVDKKVFLMGGRYVQKHWQQEMCVFTEKEESLEQVDRLIIPRPSESPAPFYAEDLSPWDDEVLYLDVHDFPTRSVWYIFNIKSRQLSKVGKVPFFGGKAFFLQCDIIKKIADEQKMKNEKR